MLDLGPWVLDSADHESIEESLGPQSRIQNRKSKNQRTGVPQLAAYASSLMTAK